MTDYVFIFFAMTLTDYSLQGIFGINTCPQDSHILLLDETTMRTDCYAYLVFQ